MCSRGVLHVCEHGVWGADDVLGDADGDAGALVCGAVEVYPAGLDAAAVHGDDVRVHGEAVHAETARVHARVVCVDAADGSVDRVRVLCEVGGALCDAGGGAVHGGGALRAALHGGHAAVQALGDPRGGPDRDPVSDLSVLLQGPLCAAVQVGHRGRVDEHAVPDQPGEQQDREQSAGGDVRVERDDPVARAEPEPAALACAVVPGGLAAEAGDRVRVRGQQQRVADQVLERVGSEAGRGGHAGPRAGRGGGRGHGAAGPRELGLQPALARDTVACVAGQFRGVRLWLRDGGRLEGRLGA